MYLWKVVCKRNILKKLTKTLNDSSQTNGSGIGWDIFRFLTPDGMLLLLMLIFYYNQGTIMIALYQSYIVTDASRVWSRIQKNHNKWVSVVADVETSPQQPVCITHSRIGSEKFVGLRDLGFHHERTALLTIQPICHSNKLQQELMEYRIPSIFLGEGSFCFYPTKNWLKRKLSAKIWYRFRYHQIFKKIYKLHFWDSLAGWRQHA